MRTPWADGPEYVTQCPIRPGGFYTYRFTIENQEGTLWWHAHSKWLRATVYGALVILPKQGSNFPFLQPQKDIPILLGMLFSYVARTLQEWCQVRVRSSKSRHFWRMQHFWRVRAT